MPLLHPGGNGRAAIQEEMAWCGSFHFAAHEFGQTFNLSGFICLTNEMRGLH